MANQKVFISKSYRLFFTVLLGLFGTFIDAQNQHSAPNGNIQLKPSQATQPAASAGKIVPIQGQATIASQPGQIQIQQNNGQGGQQVTGHEGHDHAAHGTDQANHAHEATAAGAASTTEAHGEGGFNINEMIFHHIQDSNEFHIVGDLAIPLPCILYNKQEGKLSTFMSNKFQHGHQEVDGYKLNHGVVERADNAPFIDLSITKNVFTMLLAAAILIFVFLSVAKAYKNRQGQAPKGLQGFMEPLFVFIRDEVAKPNIPNKWEKYLPYLMTIFFFILLVNLLGLIPFWPGGANASGNIAFTAVLACFTFLVMVFSGNKHFWGHTFWMPGVPTPLKPFLGLIEGAGLFIKPVSLALRLFANITGGHILVLSLVGLIFIFGKAGASASGAAAGAAISVPFTLFISAIELLVAFLQAFIFTMLSALYIGMAVDEGHSHEEAHH